MSADVGAIEFHVAFVGYAGVSGRERPACEALRASRSCGPRFYGRECISIRSRVTATRLGEPTDTGRSFTTHEAWVPGCHRVTL